MKMYFKKNGKLAKSEVKFNSHSKGAVASDLAGIGLYMLRRKLNADLNSPVMAIVK